MNGKDIKNQSEGGQEADNTASEADQAVVTREEVKGIIANPGAEERPQTSSLKEKLSSELAGIAEVSTPEWLPEKLGDYEVLAIDITNKDAMKSAEHLRKFLPYFGRLYYETFQDREKGEAKWNPDDPEFMEMVVREYLVGCDISFAKKIYMITENGRVLGYYFLKYRDLPDDKKTAHVLFTTLDKPCRGTRVNEHLSRTVFENEQVHAFTAVTHTPQLVKSWIRLGTMTDMDVYFCGRKNGDKNEPLKERERQNIDEIMEYDFSRLIPEYDCKELPPEYPHFLNYGTGSIPARKLAEVRLPSSDPVYQTFEELISLQEQEYPDDCLYGTLMMVRK